MRVQLTSLLLLVPLLLVSCGSRTPVKPPLKPVVSAAPKTPTAKAPVVEAREIAREAARHSEAARDELDKAVAKVEEFRDEEYKALQELAARLKTQGAAAVEDLDDLYTKVFAQQKHIEGLLSRMEKVSEELKSERELRQQSDNKLVEALSTIAAKDAEVAQLRLQMSDMNVSLRAFETNAHDNFEASMDAMAEARIQEGKKDSVVKALVIVSIIALLSILVNYLQFKKKSILPF